MYINFEVIGKNISCICNLIYVYLLQRCHCRTGYRLLEDGQTCADIDECEYRILNLCGQLCINTIGSYKCDCHPGFIIDGDGHHCEAQGKCSPAWHHLRFKVNIEASNGRTHRTIPKHVIYCAIFSGEPFLLVSVQTDLLIFGLQNRSLNMLPSSAKKAILSLDYDWKEKRVYWVGLDSRGIRWSSLDGKTTGTLITGQWSVWEHYKTQT